MPSAKHAAKTPAFYKKPWIYSIVGLLVIAIGLTCVLVSPKADTTPPTDVTATHVTNTEVSTDQPVSSALSLPEKGSAQSVVSKPLSQSVAGSGNRKQFGHNTNLDIEDNVFMDALLYTGYNMEKHRADGNMWIYILSERKRGLGYLSNITFNGGSTGLETTPQGLPDIKAFEKGGLVCASFATYVYFNYLPNVAGIDTSFLTKPERTYNAHSFYTAAKDWVKKGYTYTIPFEVSRTSYDYIIFKPKEEIPIGSIIAFQDDRKHDGKGSHITVYAGYKNGMHW
ncbi:MAG: hypothetical protein IKM39_03230, partial [Clostridia bacterium]|nr:hypothetical protein [Clostridia bacterium]